MRLASAAFAVLLSGVPAFVAELYVGHLDCCGSECEGSDEQGNCPPNCQYGACSKTIGATLQGSLPSVGVAAATRAVFPAQLALALSGFHVDVFHPPRA
jgi:hypothetical protein